MPVLQILCGFPGSGKSTFISQQRRSSVRPPIVLCPDDFRRILTGQDFFRHAEEMVWSHVKTSARALLTHYDVMIDATNLTVGSRAQWIAIAKEMKADCICFLMNVPFAVCLERNRKRERVVPDVVMETMRETYVEPQTDEGFFEVRKIALTIP